MEEMNNDVESKKENGQKKQSYKKPQCEVVKLFADQVLTTGCLVSIGSICTIADVNRNNN